MINKGFTFNLKIDFFDAPEEDKILAGNPKDTLPGSFWQWSVTDVKDANGTVLNMQSVIQRDALCKIGGLKLLLKDIQVNLPRFLDENGLRNN